MLLVTTVGVWVWAPDTQWETTGRDVRAAALYVVNWRLAATSVDYLAAENVPSAVQHFWSLSVEEQFYFVWPILILLLTLLALAGRSRSARRAPNTVLAGLAVVVAASFAYSVVATAAEPATAYFVTPTRVWELGIGGLLAGWMIRRAAAGNLDRGTESVPLNEGGRTLLAWAGFAAIGYTALAYSGATPFPGWQALLPVLGTAAVIGANSPARRLSPGPYLAVRPVQWLGDVSYSVYLWHWPLVVLLPSATGHDLTTTDKLGIIVGSFVLGGLTKTFVEDRFRAARWGRPLRKPFLLGAAGMVVVLLAATWLIAQYDHRQEKAKEALASALAGDDPCFGAAALADGSTCPPTTKGPVVPAPAQAVDDKSDAYDHNCWVYIPFDKFKKCTFGDPDGKVSIALVGNSHAGEWLPALQRVAENRHWKITTFLASECSTTRTPVEWDTQEKQVGCLGWADKMLAATTSGKYDVVVVANRNGRAAVGRTTETSMPQWRDGYRKVLQEWRDHDVPVLAIHDSPFPGYDVGNVPDCIAENESDLSACEGSRSKMVPEDPMIDVARAMDDPRISTVDLTDHICTKRTCPAAVGGVTVYFDASHLSATYAASLAPYLSGPLADAVARATG